MKLKSSLAAAAVLALAVAALHAPSEKGSYFSMEKYVSAGRNAASSSATSELPGSKRDISGDVLPASVPVLPARLTQEAVDQAIASTMSRYSAAAVSVAAIEHGTVTGSGAWGWAIKDERPMTPDTKLRIASISKVVIAMCAMSMAEEGILDLNAPLSTYWGPGVVNPYSKGQPTAYTLMTHTSSIKSLDTTGGLEKLRGLLQSKSSWRSMEPGSGGYWSYSNFGMCVLGTTLELASGGLMDDYLQAHFLEPMGARGSFFGGRMDVSELATLYTPGGVGRSAADHAGQAIPTQIGQGAAYFPGGFTVSAVDMAKLVSVLINDGVYRPSPGSGQYQELRLLSETSVADMETPRFHVAQEGIIPFDQCLILRRQENLLGQNVLYYHTGSAYGVYTLMSYNPDTGNGVVVLTTGAPRKTEEHGLYALCADLSAQLYALMDGAA